MTKKDLIKELQKYSDDMIVKFEYSYKPRCNCIEYCYCMEQYDRKDIYSIDINKIDEYGAKLKKEEIVLR